MNSLDDLRRTLDRHAEDLQDRDFPVRPVAVHLRVRAVRRRRAAVAAGAAALVLVGGALGVSSLRSPGTPQPASVVGVDVPRTIEVLGFPYAVEDLEELGGDDALHVDDDGEDKAVLLAGHGLGTGSATLFSGDQAIARVRASEQVSAPVGIAHAGVDLRVQFDGVPAGARAGVAVYEATGELAPGGVANADETAVFRDEVAGNPLIRGAFSEPGQEEIRVEATGPASDLSYVFYCTGDADLWVNVDVDGRGPIASSCGDAQRDAGAGSSAMTLGSTRVRDHDVRVYLTDGAEGPEVLPAGVEFGVGIYLRSSLDERVAGQRVATRVEHWGRTWRLAGIEHAPATLDTDGGDVLLGYAATGSHANVTWRGRLLPGGDGSVTLGSGGFTPAAGLLLVGDTYDVRISGDVRDAELLVYRPE